VSQPTARAESLDALFHFDEAKASRTHLGSCAVFAGPAPTLSELSDAVAGLVDGGSALARYRHLAHLLPGAGPVWVENVAFELAEHLHELSLPPPCGDHELHALISDLMTDELPSERPLWAMWLVNGLGDGRWAIVSKVHPCMVDASEGPELLGALLDVVGGLWSFVRLQSPSTPHPTTRSWSRETGPTPRWAVARCRLDDIEAISRALGTAVNGVIVAAVAGAFGDLLRLHPESPDTTRFSALVPVPDRRPEASDQPVPMMIVELPVDIADPSRRIATVAARMRRGDAPQRVGGGNGSRSRWVHTNDVVPAGQFGWVEQIARGGRWVPQRPVTTVVTNIVGPKQAAFALGREMLQYTPFVPIVDGLRLGVAAVMYNGLCNFGITGDDAFPFDAEFLAARVEVAVRDLRHLVLPIERG
jgi:diacylglycerol O-acyltransferase